MRTHLLSRPARNISLLAAGALSLLALVARAETIYGVTVYRELIKFDSATPGTILSTTPISGLTGQSQFESVRSLDFRPATGQLYAMGNAPGGIYRLYTINVSTGVATQVGADLATSPGGGGFGFNFDPALDQIRVVNDAGQNLRYNPVNGAAVADSPLVYASGDPNQGVTPVIRACSYSDSHAGSVTSLLYDIDVTQGTLVEQYPQSQGVLSTIGSLGVALPNYFNGTNLEISGVSGAAYLALSDSSTSQSQLYTVDLATGAATLVGSVGSNVILNAIAVAIPPPANADLAVTVTDSPDPVVNGGNITYHIAVHNNGPESASGVKVRVACQNGSFVSTTATHYTAGVGEYTFDLPNLASGGEAAINAVFRAHQPDQSQQQLVTLAYFGFSSATDPSNGNNSGTLTTGFRTLTAQTVYDAVIDFSLTSNPNNAWSYGHSASGGPIQFTPYDSHNGSGANGEWRRACCEFPKIHGPAQLFGDKSKSLYLHPAADANAQLSILRWTAPAAGTYQFNGQFTRGNTGHKIVAVFVNGEGLDLGYLDEPNETFPISTGLTLNTGDTVDFTSDIAEDGQASDSTGIQMRITTIGTNVQLWEAGRDLARNEKPDGAQETNAINGAVPDWSYGYRDRASGTDFTAFTAAQHTNNLLNEAVEGFSFHNANIGVNTGLASATLQGVPKPLLPGQLLLHPSQENYFPIVRWTAPATASYRILAKWIDLDANGGNGASAHVVINGTEVFGRKVPADNAGPERFVGQEWDNGGNAAMSAQTFKLNQGDKVDFAVGSRGDYNFDSTAFNALIRRVPTVTLPGVQAESVALEGSNVTVPVQVDSAAAVSKVTLLVNGQPTTSDATAPYELAINDIRAGTYYFTVVASDVNGIESASDPLKLTVLKVAAESAHAQRSGAKGSEDKTAAASSSERTYICTQSGDWSDPATWGGIGVPGQYDDAIIGRDFEVNIGTTRVDVHNIELNGRLIATTGGFRTPFFVYGTMQTSGGYVRGPSILIQFDGHFVNVDRPVRFEDTYLFNYGSTLVGERGGIVSSGSTIETYGTLQIQDAPATNRPVVARVDGLDMKSGSVLLGQHSQLISRLITDNGAGIVGAGAGNIVGAGAGNIVGAGAGNLVGQDGNSLRGPDGLAFANLKGLSLVGQDGNSLVGQDGGSLVGQDGGSRPAGLRAGDSRAEHAAALASTEITLAGGTVSGKLNFIGDVANSGAFIMPGNSPGLITVSGDYTQNANGALVMEVGGTQEEPLEFDQLQIGGSANLGGKLIVKTINDYTPQSGDTFAPLTYGAVNGSFTSITSNAQVAFGQNGATLQVSGPNPPAPKALNISTRARVEGGDNVLIGGFIITGTQAKQVIVRAIGPSLTAQGVGGALTNPKLDLYGASGLLRSNDDWRSTQEQEISAAGFAPSSSLESAILITLQPGAYTAIVSANGPAGVGLVEVYDLSEIVPAQLANISTRGVVRTGDNVMIGGFILRGDYPAKILVRAVGPSLANAGVPNVLANPTLQLVDSNGSSISNDDWRSSQEAEIIATTIAPTDDREAAILALLPPGAYTTIVRGQDDTSGVGLVEAYVIP